ncbi:MAG: hypothetical protein ABGX24_05090 [Aquificota bacterium]|jgi:hypothetical protein
MRTEKFLKKVLLIIPFLGTLTFAHHHHYERYYYHHYEDHYYHHREDYSHPCEECYEDHLRCDDGYRPCVRDSPYCFKNTSFAIRNILKIALSVVIWIIEKAKLLNF